MKQYAGLNLQKSTLINNATSAISSHHLKNLQIEFRNLLRYSTDYNEIITTQLNFWKSEKENYEYKCLIYGDRTNSDTGTRYV